MSGLFKKRSYKEVEKEDHSAIVDCKPSKRKLVKSKVTPNNQMDIDEIADEYNSDAEDFEVDEDSSYYEGRLNNSEFQEENSLPLDNEDYVSEQEEANKLAKETRKVTLKKKKRKISDTEDNDIECITQDENDDKLDLPCRSLEQQSIEAYIRKGLDTVGGYHSLYISGMPGTGKTASVLASIKKLSGLSKRKVIKEFQCFLINGMKINNNNMIYKQIYSKIFANEAKLNPYKCCKLLDEFFKDRISYNFNLELRDSRNIHIILIIDEVDCLVTKKMSLLYNIFNWSLYPNAKLIIISISNTIDLPQRTINKVSSRIGSNQISFKPYQRDELEKILKVTLPNYNLFTNDAIKYCCSKVASISGDIRRILTICKYAEDLWMKKNSGNMYNPNLKHQKALIQIDDVKTASNELYDKKVSNVIKSLKIFEKIVIIAISKETEVSPKVDMSTLYKRFIFCVQKLKEFNYQPSFDDFKHIIFNLSRMKLINVNDHNENFISNMVNVLIYKDELISALCSDENLKNLIENN